MLNHFLISKIKYSPKIGSCILPVLNNTDFLIIFPSFQCLIYFAYYICFFFTCESIFKILNTTKSSNNTVNDNNSLTPCLHRKRHSTTC